MSTSIVIIEPFTWEWIDHLALFTLRLKDQSYNASHQTIQMNAPEITEGFTCLDSNAARVGKGTCLRSTELVGVQRCSKGARGLDTDDLWEQRGRWQDTIDKETPVLGKMVIEPNVRVMSPHLLFTSSRVHKMEFRSQDQGAYNRIPSIRRRWSWRKWSSSWTSVSCHPHLLFTSSRVHKMEFRSQDQGARLRQNTIDKETLVLGEMVIEPNVRVMSPSLAVHEFTSSENGVQIARSGAKLRQNKLTKSRPLCLWGDQVPRLANQARSFSIVPTWTTTTTRATQFLVCLSSFICSSLHQKSSFQPQFT